ncbi:MAG TPA: hypothetical protein PKK10_13640 [Woeseiaceae bacterium]|nr:hypothetical protein [Woeseiaceae bacterium]
MRQVRIAAMLLTLVLTGFSPAGADEPATAKSSARVALNVSIAVFDPGVPDDQSQFRDLKIFPRIRQVEARFLPFVLRDTLANSHDWGAVRVVPEPDIAAELLVTGTILRSDGAVLALKIRAVDAGGHVWLDKAFSGPVADTRAVADKSGIQQPVFAQVAVELEAAQRQRDAAELRRISDISLIRYGNRLAPSAFGQYLNEGSDGTFSLKRLPAANDPMLERIQRIRGVEYIFTDAVDTKFRELNSEIASIYALWREHRRKSLEYEKEDARWAATSTDNLERGSYESIQNIYDNYKFHRITQQEQDKLAIAFNNEVGPKVDAMEQRIAELEFWVEQRYIEWHRLLEQLFEAETQIEQ